MCSTEEQQQLLSVLEDTANLLRKTQNNLRKCPKQRLTKGYIEARMKTIDEYWQTFKSAHQDLVKITPKAHKGTLPYFVNEEFFIYEDIYSVLQGDLKDMIIALSGSSAVEPGSANSSFILANQQNKLIHLPKIQLPKFSGTYESWQTFEDLFTSLVHNNTSLSDVQKLHFLKTSVTHGAETLLKHIQVTDSNYAHAWDILKTRYGNKRLILNHSMRRLFNQKKMTSQSASQLKGLLDTTTECLHSLNTLSIDTSSWDPVLIYLLVQKLDSETHKNWEEYAYKEDSECIPTWSDLKKFLETKFRTLELTNQNTITKDYKPTKERSFHAATPVTEKVCVMCKDNHTLSHCKDFCKLEPNKRSEFVKEKHLCYNCLVPGHSAFKCKLPVSCRLCHRRHHSLLHEKKDTKPEDSSVTSSPATTHVEDEQTIQVNTMMTSQCSAKQRVALLATAVVEATSEQGHTILLRALIDQGSEAAFISEKATQLLKLERQPIKGSVIGVGSTRTEMKHVVQLQIRSQWDRNYCLPVKAYVMPKQLTTRIPMKTISTPEWSHIQGLNLADPTYFMPGSIADLLGVKEYAEILQNNLIKGPPGSPSAQKTNLGWILFGEVYTTQQDKYVVMHHSVDIEDMLKSIWEIDSDTKRHLTKEEQLCEELYERTTTRTKEGRYMVRLPFKTNSPQSPDGNTKSIAAKRFVLLEKKFNKSPDLKRDYTKVISDYMEQGHLERVPEKEKDKRALYLPHHAVIRDDKESSRTRVVFDASCKGSNDLSLNDELLVGPQLQEDLRNILMRWRMKHICLVADITQMYRQILVHPDDADYQRILWRQHESDIIEEYRLLRVTFGTASAPYLAVKTLQQIAKDEAKTNNFVARTINEDFYMDDLLSGTDTVDEAITLSQELSHTLKKGGFILTKWASNSIEVMKSIEEDKRSVNANIDLNLDGTIKALGITWNLKTDQFQYNCNFPANTKPITKRNILSDIQKLFDPLGWIAPSTVMAKILIQKLWLERLQWDDEVIPYKKNGNKSDLISVISTK